MLSPTHPGASIFLLVLSGLVAALVALPLVFVPLAWARAIGWSIPKDTDLVFYLARCLGVVVLSVLAVLVQAAPHVAAHPELFDMLGVVGVTVAGVHLWGALERRQPPAETWETLAYAVLAIVAWWVKP